MSSIPYENRTVDFYCRDDDGGTHPLACAAHLHVHIEFFYLLEGKMRVFVDSAEQEAQAGDVVIAFPNQVHRFERIEPEKYLLFIVHPDMMPELSDIFSGKLPDSPRIKGVQDLFPLLSQMQAVSHQATPLREVTIRGLLLAFFGQLLERVELTKTGTEDSHAIRAIVHFCAHNFSGDLSLELLEQNLHLSRYYISHLFSHRLCIRFNDYVNSLRVTEACRLLRATSESVTDIAAQVGFNTLRTFNRSFSKQMGQSPSEYRRQLRAASHQNIKREDFNHE